MESKCSNCKYAENCTKRESVSLKAEENDISVRVFSCDAWKEDVKRVDLDSIIGSDGRISIRLPLSGTRITDYEVFAGNEEGRGGRQVISEASELFQSVLRMEEQLKRMTDKRRGRKKKWRFLKEILLIKKETSFLINEFNKIKIITPM